MSLADAIAIRSYSWNATFQASEVIAKMKSREDSLVSTMLYPLHVSYLLHKSSQISFFQYSGEPLLLEKARMNYSPQYYNCS